MATHYTIEQGTRIKKSFHSSESKVILVKEKISTDDTLNLYKSAAVATTFILNDIVIPLFVKYVPKLLYHPQKFIKEHHATHSLINGTLSTNNFVDIKNIIYSKKLLMKNQEKGVTAINIIFKLGSIHVDGDANNTVNYLELTGLKFNYSEAKLKSATHRINLNIEVIYHYINSKHKQKTITLQPFFLNNVIPDGESKIEAFEGEKVRLLPKMYVVTAVQIKVTEINSKKKFMDTWLEVYHDNKDILSSTLKEVVKK